MGDENPIRTLRDYSKPSHEGYRNTIELPIGNNVVPLRSDTIQLVQNRCSFHGLWFEDPNQHLKDFLKLVDSLDLDRENKERTHPRRIQKNHLNRFRNSTSRSRYRSVSKQTTRHLPQSCLMLTLEGFPFITVNTKEYHSECSGNYHKDNA
ncbi:hypothetical protein Tco_1435300 [Tanacetum coccineum]